MIKWNRAGSNDSVFLDLACEVIKAENLLKWSSVGEFSYGMFLL